jgi:hypothetical protein
MQGGTIRNNRAALGGGIDIIDNGRTNMSGGTITGNESSSGGGGVWVSGAIANGQGFNMTGGAIINNNAINGGGGILSNGGNPANVSIGANAIVTGNTPNNTNIPALGLHSQHAYTVECHYALMEYRQQILLREQNSTEYLGYNPTLLYGSVDFPLS